MNNIKSAMPDDSKELVEYFIIAYVFGTIWPIFDFQVLVKYQISKQFIL